MHPSQRRSRGRRLNIQESYLHVLITGVRVHEYAQIRHDTTQKCAISKVKSRCEHDGGKVRMEVGVWMKS